jgi:hypothetical protein
MFYLFAADKKLLASNAKLPLKYPFDDVKYQSQRLKGNLVNLRSVNRVVPAKFLECSLIHYY